MNSNSKLHVETGDITNFSIRDASPAALIAYLLAIENEHPGMLAWCVRQAALIDANWRMSARSSNPDASLEAQKYGIHWMKKFDELQKSAQSKGVEHFAEY